MVIAAFVMVWFTCMGEIRQGNLFNSWYERIRLQTMAVSLPAVLSCNYRISQ